MKFFNKLLLSAISMIAMTNSVSYSMDTSNNNSNNYYNRSYYSTNYQNYSAYKSNENYKNKKAELSDKDKENITKDIDNILDNIENYSNDLLKVNRNTLFGLNTKIKDEESSITDKNKTLLSLIAKSCESGNDIFYLGKKINSSTTSINNLKPRIDIIEKKVVNEKTKGKTTIKLMKLKNEYETNIINSKNFFRANITISDIIKMKTIDDLTSEFIKTNNNEFLSKAIESIKRHILNINTNITLNNILINDIRKSVKSLRIQCCNVYGRIDVIKSIICSNEEELKKLSKQINDNGESISELDKKFKEIQGYQTNKEKELPIKKDKIINESDNLNNENNIQADIQPIEKQKTEAQKNIIEFETKFEQSLNEFKKKYRFDSKTYITKIIESIKSKVYIMKNINTSNEENIDKLLQVISSCINDEIIDNLSNNNKHMQYFISTIENLNNDHSNFIKKTQREFCKVENEYDIKKHLAYKFKEAIEQLAKIQKEVLDIQYELAKKTVELEDAKNEIQKLTKGNKYGINEYSDSKLQILNKQLEEKKKELLDIQDKLDRKRDELTNKKTEVSDIQHELNQKKGGLQNRARKKFHRRNKKNEPNNSGNIRRRLSKKVVTDSDSEEHSSRNRIRSRDKDIKNERK